MSDREITIRLPERWVERYEQVANKRHQSVEDIITQKLTELSMPEFGDMELLSDKELWDVFETRMTDEQYERLEDLIEFGNGTEAELAEIEMLSQIANSQMLARSIALALLNQRGYETSHFFKMK
jgi:hypothetical protein